MNFATALPIPKTPYTPQLIAWVDAKLFITLGFQFSIGFGSGLRLISIITVSAAIFLG